MNKYLIISGLILGLISLNGCSGVANTLGLEKEAPDEFAVITRAPLEMPDKLTLPPPKLGMLRPQEKAANRQARDVLLGKPKTNNETTSFAEESLLQRAGTSNIDPNIRTKINKETAELENRNKAVAEKLLNIGGNSKTPSATIIDAKKELERIQKNKAEGKNITDGETPVIEE